MTVSTRSLRNIAFAGHGGTGKTTMVEEMLAAGGAMVLEFGYTQADAISELLAATGAFDPPRVIRDHQGIERSLVAIRRA